MASPAGSLPGECHGHGDQARRSRALLGDEVLDALAANVREFWLVHTRPVPRAMGSAGAGEYYSAGLGDTWIVRLEDGSLSFRREAADREILWEGASLDKTEYLGDGRFRFGDDEIVFEGDESCDDGFTLSVDRARGIRF